MREESQTSIKKRKDIQSSPPPLLGLKGESGSKIFRAGRVDFHGRPEGRIRNSSKLPHPGRTKNSGNSKKTDDKTQQDDDGSSAYNYPDSPTVKGINYIIIGSIIVPIGPMLVDICSSISLIGYLIAFVGIWKIYRDKLHFPDPHSSNMKTSLFVYFLGIINLIIGFGIIIAATQSRNVHLTSDGYLIEELWNIFITNKIVSGLYLAIGGSLWLIASYILLFRLISPENKSIFFGVLILAIFLTAYGTVLNSRVADDMRGIMDNMDDFEDSDHKTIQDEMIVRRKAFDSENKEIRWKSNGMIIIGQLIFLPFLINAWEYQNNNPQLRSAQPPYPPPGPPPYPPPLKPT
jgi:hypothetical protein